MNELVESAPAEHFNFARHVLELNRGRAARAAYTDDRETIDHAELARRVRCCAAHLLGLGLRPEERVLLVMHDTNDWPVAFLACLYTGIVPVAVNTQLGVDDYAWLLGHSRARAALVSGPLRVTITAAAAQSGRTLSPLIVSRPQGELPQGAIAFHGASHRARQAQANLEAADTRADDIAFWLYSSGSTGRPKGVVHTHGNLFATNATYGRHVLGLREDDRVFSAAKLFFAYGLGNALTFPLCAGAETLLLPERPTPEAVFETLAKRRPTVFCGVPTLFASMLASPALPARDQLTLRLCTSAGEGLPRELGERFAARFGAPVLDGVGSTELLHVFLANRVDRLRYGHSGFPVPGYDLELRDDHGQPVGDDELGDLYVRGPSAALMYWANREKSRTTFLGEWTRAGDKFIRDAEGCYTYAGRCDDMFKVSGQYVSPFEIEATLAQHPAVLETAVVAHRNGEGLIKPRAFVVLKDPLSGNDVLRLELQDFVKTRLTKHKYPRVVDFIDELPKTPTGKIQRFRLRELDRQGEAG